MNDQVATALVSGLVALLVAGGSGLLTLVQIRREYRKWRTDLKAAWALENHKTRLASYPDAFAVIRRLSHGSSDAATPQVAAKVADDLNDWLYSTGGMCADADTRGALLGLRHSCRRWAESGGQRPDDLYTWRNLTLEFLRRDLDIMGLETYGSELDATMLEKLQQELENPRARKVIKKTP
ncbi:hypothetical protein [Streptomyces canus]|uniref:hypothetical protein n=1 Tax=Streptomyces canus TaxID=58343 RepID=UPI002DDC3B47|nr:hypothetical protein [Streptomyces canus]WSD92678.1 hypothetical protein OG925_51395 [Streptomyces canus]